LSKNNTPDPLRLQAPLKTPAPLYYELSKFELFTEIYCSKLGSTTKFSILDRSADFQHTTQHFVTD